MGPEDLLLQINSSEEYYNLMQSSPSVNLPTTQQIPEKQINLFIHELEPIEHTDDDYKDRLSLWQNYQSIGKEIDEKIASNAIIKPRRSPTPIATNLCELCFDQLSWRPKWCRICGCHCCDKCITRARKLPGYADPVLFCERCDRSYMQGMIAKQFCQKIRLRESAFKTLGNEQETFQSLLKMQMHKVMQKSEQTGEKNQLIELGNRIVELASENRSIHSEISEMNKKLEWGYSIHKQLTKKMRKTKRLYQASFTSSVNQDPDGIAPPEADASSAISVQNLNESVLNSMFDEEEGRQSFNQGRKCNCQLM